MPKSTVKGDPIVQEEAVTSGEKAVEHTKVETTSERSKVNEKKRISSELPSTSPYSENEERLSE